MNRFLIPSAALVLGLTQCQRKESNDSGNVSTEVGAPKTSRLLTSDRIDPMGELGERRKAAESLPDGPERIKALEEVAWNALELDPPLARKLLEDLPHGSPGRTRLTAHLAMRLADESTQAAVEWASAIDSPEERQAAFTRVAVIMANDDPVNAAKLLFEEVDEGHTRDRGIVQIIQRWSKTDPEGAISWIGTFPSGRLRNDSLYQCLGQWIRTDARAAASWLSHLDDSELRDDAVRQASPLLAGSASYRSAEFLDALPDSELRGRLEMPSEK